MASSQLSEAKITLWSPLQYYLREKWDWPSRSKGNKKSSKHPHNEEGARDHSSSDAAGGPATGVRCNRCFCEHESAPIGFKKPRNPRPSASSDTIHHDTISEGDVRVTLDVKEREVFAKVNKQLEKNRI
ncbi:hypothetical protein DAPPUDRAFT_112941 [Daphnia pulex]|uniref:Uncharacterized protein n=1 Tax=Daphnia pulex TaxID=6669 RepID=E9HDJ1_DAPPU|nr:hypothetical protein DAPPUDRAFT_112941 [Daphnia pulex]|eukprot:EFX70149.1 hypothetical protein DAPPUDRAFT_112941 [Daphnia pulex]